MHARRGRTRWHATCLGSVVIAPDAEAIPSCMNADNVAALDTGCVLGGLSFTNFVVSPAGTNGHDLSPSPEPTTLLLVGSSLAALGLALRRRSRAGRAAEGAIET
jgi:hypothetical protein